MKKFSRVYIIKKVTSITIFPNHKHFSNKYKCKKYKRSTKNPFIANKELFSIRYDDIFQMMKEGKKELSSNRQKSASLSLLWDSGLSARRSAWASVSTSGPIEDDRSRRHKVAASHLGFEPLDGAASRVLAEEGGRRKSRVGREGEDKWPGRGSPLKRSSGVSSVEARVWPKAHSTPPAPLVLVSS